jgi:hypothetical protein
MSKQVETSEQELEDIYTDESLESGSCLFWSTGEFDQVAYDRAVAQRQREKQQEK